MPVRLLRGLVHVQLEEVADVGIGLILQNVEPNAAGLIALRLAAVLFDGFEEPLPRADFVGSLRCYWMR